MPVLNEASFVTELLDPERRTAQFIFNWQTQVIKDEVFVQSLTRRQALSRISRPVKDGAKTVNDFHLNRLRTGYFDRIFMEGARSVEPTYVKMPDDTRKIQSMSMDYYLKMRNARQFTARDAERFVGHVWEDKVSRHKALGRTTNYLGNRLIERGPDNIDRQYGVKAGVGADGRKWSYTKYARMQGDAFANKLYNEGALTAAERMSRNRIVAIRVSDGPDCGWTYHDDPEKANGMVVSVAEARAHPIAHPYCVRRFSASTKKKDTDKASERIAQAKIARKILTGVAVGGLSAYAASAVSNIAAAQISRFAAGRMFEQWLNHLRGLIWNGDTTAQSLYRYAIRFQERFVRLSPEMLSERRRFTDLPLAFKVERAWPGGPEWSSLPEEIHQLKIVGDELLYRARHFDDDAKRFLNAVLPGHRDEEQMQLLMEGVHRALRSKENRANLRSVANAEVQRRNLVYRTLLKLPGGEQFASKVKLTWTSWGTRLRIDNFDWLRSHITFTPAGLIRSLSFFPKTAFRSVIKMYADGSIGGHISALPRNFLRGIFRAVVEVDEHGALIGNLRVVTGGPLKLTLNFITRQPGEIAQNIAEQFTHWLVLNHGDQLHNFSPDMIGERLVTFLHGHSSPLGFKTRDLANRIVRNLRDEGLIEGPMAEELNAAIIRRGARLTFDPRDIFTAAKEFGAARVMRDLGYAVRQFRFDSARIEWRIFNRSIFDISANLRVPIETIRRVVEDLALQKLLTSADNVNWSGVFRWVITNPVELFQTVRFTSLHLLEETGRGIKSTLFAGIRFSGLKAQELNPFLQALRTGSVRFLSRLHFDQDGLRSVATNMKIFGWNIYRIADVLSLRVQDVRALIDEGWARMHLMAYRLGFTKLDDAIPNWDAAVDHVRGMFINSVDHPGEPIGRAEALLRVTKAMKNEFTNPVEDRALRYLAGILPSDSQTQIRLKLLHLRNWINTTESRKGIIYRDWASSGAQNPFGFPGLPPGVRAEYLKVYRELGEFAQDITHDDLVAKASEMALKSQRLMLVPGRAVQGAVADINYMFGRFMQFFIERGSPLTTILRNWDRLVTNLHIRNRTFIPNSYSVTRLSPEADNLVANWKRYAVDESPNSFTVGETRFVVEEEERLHVILGEAISRGDVPTITEARLIDVVDDEFVKETLRLQAYTRQRFPNLEDMPTIRITIASDKAANSAMFSYYQGYINVHADWAFRFKQTSANLDEFLRYDRTTGLIPLTRRITGDNMYDRQILHETAHWLTDHMTTAELEELMDVIEDNTVLKMRYLKSDEHVNRYLDAWASTGIYKPRDPLGNPFQAWRREAMIRAPLDTENNLYRLRFGIMTPLGRYGTMNMDELISESMSHYLYHRDPAGIGRLIGGFYDEKLLGKATARMVDHARPVAGKIDEVTRDAIEGIFKTEIPSAATQGFTKRALDIVQKANRTATTPEEVDEFLFSRYFKQLPTLGKDTLDDGVRTYWQYSEDNVRTVRIAWLEMQGIKTNKKYTETDVLVALRMSKQLDEATPNTAPIFRGISYDIDDEDVLQHIDDLTTVGKEIELPLTSFADEAIFSDSFSLGGLDSAGHRRGIQIELEEGAHTILYPARTEAEFGEQITQGRFEVVSVLEDWVPDDEYLELVYDELIGEEADPSQKEQNMASLKFLYENYITKVFIRRVG